MAVIDLKRLKLPADMGALMAKLPPVANLLLVVLVAQTLAVLTWKLIPSPDLPAPPANVSPANSGNQTSPVSSAQARIDLASWHLFGEVPREAPTPVVAEVVPQEAPDTSLSLTLLGVMTGNEQTALAIISDRTGNEETYGIESPLPGGAILKEIHADRVILLHNNRFETLRLPQELVETGSSPVRAPLNARNNSSNARSAPAQPRGAVTRLENEAAQVVKQYKSALMNDPQSVMDAVRAEPYRQGGQLKGYRIFPGRDKQLLGQVGLLPGDVVIAVNGIELDSPLKGLEIMQQVQEATEVSVDVLRNGSTQTFLVPLN